MKHNNPSLNKSPATDWQILGELELTDHTVGKWLATILSPLDLPADFLNKVLKSAQDAMARAMQNGTKFEHIHLLVFAPKDRSSKRQTWGFFRIEKIESAAADEGPPDHAIEFYLYLEGQ